MTTTVTKDYVRKLISTKNIEKLIIENLDVYIFYIDAIGSH